MTDPMHRASAAGEGTGQERREEGVPAQERRSDPAQPGADRRAHAASGPGTQARPEGRAQDRRAGDRRAGSDRRSGTDRRGLIGHAREFATKFKEPLIGLGVAAAAMPLIRAGDTAEHAKSAEKAAEQTPASDQATAAATRASDANRDIDAEVGAQWSTADRDNTVQAAVDKYAISPELAGQIYDHARDAGVDPKMAYGLVKTESDFKNTAVSHVGARGLTQLMPGTARWLKPGTTASDLFDPRTSLEVGFKYLRQLIDRYDGNRHLALTAYNRGPGIVERAIKRGHDPDNGYAGTVLRNALRAVSRQSADSAQQSPG